MMKSPRRKVFYLLAEAFGYKYWNKTLDFYCKKGFRMIFKKNAFLLYKIHRNWAKIEYIVIKREFRGKGIGSRLLKQFEKICRRKNIDAIFVDAHEGRAINFYLKNGFKIILKAILPDEPPSYILFKRLSNKDIDFLKIFWDWAKIVYSTKELSLIKVFEP